MDFPAAIIAAYSVTLDVGWLVRRDDIIVMVLMNCSSLASDTTSFNSLNNRLIV